MSKAEAQGIELFRAGLKLRWEADQQPPSALVEQWRQHRSQLVGWLASEEDAPAPFDFPRQLWPSIVEALSRFEADHETDAQQAGQNPNFGACIIRILGIDWIIWAQQSSRTEQSLLVSMTRQSPSKAALEIGCASIEEPRCHPARPSWTFVSSLPQNQRAKNWMTPCQKRRPSSAGRATPEASPELGSSTDRQNQSRSNGIILTSTLEALRFTKHSARRTRLPATAFPYLMNTM